MSTWTIQQVEALAPDDSSAKAGKGLGSASKWKNLGCTDAAAWGECQGSGKDPYQTQVDLSEPAFRCSCPSRKFPCKHGLGLMFILAGQPAAFKEDAPPGWVSEWLAGRAEKAEAKAEKQAQKAEKAAAQPVDAVAQAKRAAQRSDRVAAGLDYVEIWLKDLVRAGLSTVPSRPYSFWETPAARMVDAQAPGVGRMIREMSSISTSREGWQERLLEKAGRLYLLLEGYRRLDTVPPDTQADIRSLVGWTISQEELLAGHDNGVRDRWHVVGQRIEDDDRVRVQRTWLWGQASGRAALLLHFAAFGQALDRSFVPGCIVEAELVYFPSAFPLRALVRSRSETEHAHQSPRAFGGFPEALRAYADALTVHPWLEEFPMGLLEAIPARVDGRWLLRDSEGNTLPIAEGFAKGWHLHALAGGHPMPVFGEWNGDHFLPLCAWIAGRIHTISTP